MEVGRPASERQCIRCGAPTPELGVYCEGCGGQVAGGLAEELEWARQRRLRRARFGLLAIALLHTVLLVVLYVRWKGAPQESAASEDAWVVLWLAGLGTLVSWALWWWSRSNPFVAGVVGLTLCLADWAFDVAEDPSRLYRGVVLRLVVVGVLAHVVSAGAQLRKAKRSSQA